MSNDKKTFQITDDISSINSADDWLLIAKRDNIEYFGIYLNYLRLKEDNNAMHGKLEKMEQFIRLIEVEKYKLTEKNRATQS